MNNLKLRTFTGVILTLSQLSASKEISYLTAKSLSALFIFLRCEYYY